MRHCRAACEVNIAAEASNPQFYAQNCLLLTRNPCIAAKRSTQTSSKEDSLKISGSDADFSLGSTCTRALDHARCYLSPSLTPQSAERAVQKGLEEIFASRGWKKVQKSCIKPRFEWQDVRFPNKTKTQTLFAESNGRSSGAREDAVMYERPVSGGFARGVLQAIYRVGSGASSIDFILLRRLEDAAPDATNRKVVERFGMRRLAYCGEPSQGD